MAALGLFMAQAAQSRPGDVPLPGNIQHAGAQQPGVNRQRHKGDRHGGQNQMLPVAVAHRREPFEINRKEHHQQKRQPEVGHRDAQERDHPDDEIRQPIAMARGPNTQRHGGKQDQHQRRTGQQQRCGQKVHHVVQHRALGGEGDAKIQVQRPPQPGAVLHD
ncbi:hypothetical protein D3C71_1605730 [compost metagenome]